MVHLPILSEQDFFKAGVLKDAMDDDSMESAIGVPQPVSHEGIPDHSIHLEHPALVISNDYDPVIPPIIVDNVMKLVD